MAKLYSALSTKKIEDLLECDNKHELAVWGMLDAKKGRLTLWLATGRIVRVPLTVIQPNAVSKPDFRKFKIVDWGYAVAFGKYEASVRSLTEATAEIKRAIGTVG